MDGQLWTMIALLAALAALAWLRGGEALVREGLGRGVAMLLDFALVLVVSSLAAGLAMVLVPAVWFQRALGADAGLRGILIGTGAGLVTPAGPFVAMPIAVAMLKAGAAVGPVLAYLTGWSLLALHRLVAWEIPIIGARLALLRWVLSLAVPVLVGLAARALVGR